MTEETKSESPSSPARATIPDSIPESPRLTRLLEFAYEAGIDVVNNHYAYTVHGDMTFSYVTIEELEKAVVDEAEYVALRGREATEALAKWREGR